MDPILGQIQAFGFSFAPMGWLLCQGQILNISIYPALYALLGTKFGGNGSTTFGIPDLQGRTIVGLGTATGFDNILLGQKGGAESVILTEANLPPHIHPIINGDGVTAGTVKVATKITTTPCTSPSNESKNGTNGLGTGGAMPAIYRESPSGADFIGGVFSTVSGTTGNTGTGTKFTMRNPYLGLFYCIATEGLFPPRE